MNIGQAYEIYQIMPQLSLHMRRVAGVGKLILEGWQGVIDRDLVLKSLLLHDMGNIVKFDLASPLMPIENMDYWMQVQQNFWKKYGRDTHEATKAIIRELKQDQVNKVMDEEHDGYSTGDTSKLLSKDWPAKILAYCDVRVVPSGVTTLEERIKDLSNRYHKPVEWYDFLYQLEENLRVMTTTNLEQITEETVAPYFDEWLTYNI
jgi:hypothetical protein